MALIEPLRKSFSNLGSTPTAVLTTTAHPLIVQSITVCNRGNEAIYINLKVNCVDSGVTTSPLLLTNFLVPAALTPVQYKSTTIFSGVDLLGSQVLDQDITLLYAIGSTDSITLYSNATPQKFDCYITYRSLTEIP